MKMLNYPNFFILVYVAKGKNSRFYTISNYLSNIVLLVYSCKSGFLNLENVFSWF